MAAASSRDLLLPLLLTVLSLAAGWPTQAYAASYQDTTTKGSGPSLMGHRRLLAVTNGSMPTTPVDVALSMSLYVPFMYTGQRQRVSGEATVRFSFKDPDCSKLTVTLTTNDTALSCEPSGPFMLGPSWRTWCNWNNYPVVDDPSEDAKRTFCTAVHGAAGPVQVTATARQGSQVLATQTSLVTVEALPVPPPNVQLQVGPKSAVADARGRGLFQVTVTGLADCSLATLGAFPLAGATEVHRCWDPTNPEADMFQRIQLVQGPDGTCTTQGPVPCSGNPAEPDDNSELPSSNRAIVFLVAPVMDRDPRVTYGWVQDLGPVGVAYVRDPPAGTKPGVQPVSDGKQQGVGRQGTGRMAH
jgi:hypothetical protein